MLNEPKAAPVGEPTTGMVMAARQAFRLGISPTEAMYHALKAGSQAGAAYQRQSGVVMPELAECWKLADQLANGSHFDSVPNHDDDSPYELADCGDPRRLRLQAERADDLTKMLAKLVASLNGAGSHE